MSKKSEKPAAKGLTDFNDLHVLHGIGAVQAQLDAGLDNFKSAAPEQLSDSVDLSPPEYLDIPPPGYGPGDLPGEDSPAPPGEAERATVDDLLKRYALLMPDGKVWDAHKRQIIKKSAFKDFVGAEVFKQWLEHDGRRTVDKAVTQKELPPPIAGGRGLMAALMRYVYVNHTDFVWDRETRDTVTMGHLKYSIADCFDDWLKHPNRVEVPKSNFVFDPSQKVDPLTHINTFRGFAIKPDKDVFKCMQITEALFNICNRDEAVYWWLLRWLAYPLQNPGAKMATAVLVHSSVHGSGKSYFFDVVMRSIYGEYSKTVGQAQLEGSYNDWQSQTLYACYEEVLSRGQKYSHTGTIKQMITGTKVRIEKKFMSGWEESNHMNAVFLSNEILPLPLEPSDRRFLVIWPEEVMYTELQKGVDAELANGGGEAFYGLLLGVDMRMDDGEMFGPHTKPPMTLAKQKLIGHNTPIWEVFYNAWSEGRLEWQGAIVPYCHCRVGDLFRLYDRWAQAHNETRYGCHKFQSFIASKIRKRPDVDYSDGMGIKKATFFIVDGIECPKDTTQKDWLGSCVKEFERILNRGQD